MRINFRYGAAVGILAAAFATLGPVAAQAGQTPGTSAPTGAGAVTIQPPAPRLLAITGKSVVLSSAFERPAWQRDIRIGQREDNSVANGQERLGLPGQQDRVLVQSSRCGGGHYGYDRCCYGYDHGRCCGYGYDHGRCCGYGYGYDHGRCCGYGYDHGRCCGYGYGYDHGRCCGYGYDHGRCVSHYGA